ncbi:MAG TPA: hypothetical protein VHK27_10510 [Gammaproteobacteria bacterium]|nr:hypothetical protein [Gammaproteobacteria bacterium]
MDPPQGSQVRAPIQAAAQNLYTPGWQVGDQTDPFDPGLGPAGLHPRSKLVSKQEVGKIDPCARPQRMVAPSAGIDVQ